MKIQYLIFVAFLMSSCTTLPPQYDKDPLNPQARYGLNSGAEKVQVVEFLPTKDRAKYDEVQISSCAIGANGYTAETNLDFCMNKLKNDAHAIGSTLVLLKPENKRVGVDKASDEFTGHQWSCTECVDLKGIILKPKASATVSD